MNKNYIWLLSLCSLTSFAQTEAQLDSISAAFETQLGEIFIKADKPVFKQSSDKMVFNVESSIMSTGSNILEVLGRTPGIVVSEDGDLSLRGKNGVSVMINGKLSQLSSKELANLLRSTNSSVVKNIEIIANPSAKYDAAGNAGIINIIMKKSTLEGLNGNYYINGGRGRKNRLNTGLSLNYTHDKFNVYGDYNYTFRGEEERKDFYQEFHNGLDNNQIDRQTIQNYTTSEPLTSNNFKIGADYNISSRTTIGVLFDAKIGRYENYSLGNSSVYAPVGSLLTQVQSDNANKEHWYDYTTSLSLTHFFNDKNYKVDVDIDYETSKFRSTQQQLSDVILNLANEDFLNRKGKIPSNLKSFNGKIDFSLPFNDDNTLETGWKSTVKSNDNPSTYEVEKSMDWVNDPNATNHYKYEEQIHAIYANYKLVLNKWSLQAGLRTEYTETDINQKTIQERTKKDYTKFFPSASIKYETESAHGFYASYSKRINRPSHFDLNPFRFYNDPFNYWQGNPNLKPEITHATEIGYTWDKYLIANVYYSVTHDVMTQVYDYQKDTGILVKGKDNLSKSYHYGINLTNSVSPTNWWDLTSMFNLFNNKYEGDYQNASINSSQVAYTINAQNNFKLPWGLRSELNAQYFSKYNIGLYKRDGYFDMTIGLSKSLCDDKGSLKIALTDALNTKHYRITANNLDSHIRQKYDLDSRIVTLSFNYKI